VIAACAMACLPKDSVTRLNGDLSEGPHAGLNNLLKTYGEKNKSQQKREGKADKDGCCP
jgi:hypothetical protein